ncbi:YncE family protein [Streptomyces sp. NPDC054933]
MLDTRQDTVSLIDTRSHRVIARTRVGRTPWQVALSPDGARVYVTGANDDTVTVIDTADNTVLRTVRVNHDPPGSPRPRAPSGCPPMPPARSTRSTRGR